MFKKLTLLALVVLSTAAFAQRPTVYKNSWDLGFGINSPRFTGDVTAEALNFGGHFFVANNLNESQSFRARLDVNNFTSNKPTKGTTLDFALGLDYSFRLFQCEPVAPFFGAGFSIHGFNVADGFDKGLNKFHFGELGAKIFFGAFLNFLDLGPNWRVRTELANVTLSTDIFDGMYGSNGGVFGGTLDSYIAYEIGVQYYYSHGDRSRICDDLPGGATSEMLETQGKKLDELGKRLAQMDDKLSMLLNKEPVKVESGKTELAEMKDMLKKYFEARPTGSVNVNFTVLYFDVNKSEVREDSYKDMIDMSNALLANPTIKIELQGYTDDAGSVDANKKLANARAEFVKSFFVKRGVSADRISMSGYGEDNPVANNKTATGRKLNRRVEVRVK